MPGGLVALLDDVSIIARTAAASIDDIGVAASKAGSKTAGVVIDDAAVTPSYVTGLSPARELPIIWNITKGSLKNKLIILLPGALLLSWLLPSAILFILMAGGAYLSYEGAEKVMEKLGGQKHGLTVEDEIVDPVAFEKQRVSGAIRTDLILSAEIMVISLNEVADEPFLSRAVILAVVGVGITALVYGVVAVIVKVDDVGLGLTQRASATAQRLGHAMVAAMPRLLTVIGVVGTAAMLWVGGHILLVGVDELGWHALYDAVHHLEEQVHDALGAVGATAAWLVNTAASAALGLLVGAVVVALAHLRPRRGSAANS